VGIGWCIKALFTRRGIADGLDVLSFCDGFNNQRIGTLRKALMM
jgi:hypothetical protein